jgi:hypothetical protein
MIDDNDKSYLYHKLIDYTCMLSIGCKPMILITLNMAKTCLKVSKDSCFRLMSSYCHLKPCYVGSILLSVVGQSFLCNILCAGLSLSPPLFQQCC